MIRALLLVLVLGGLTFLGQSTEPGRRIVGKLMLNGPSVDLRGIVRRGTHSQPEALLEINGLDVYSVRVNDEIRLEGWFSSHTVRVKEIDRQTVLVEFDSPDKQLRLH